MALLFHWTAVVEVRCSWSLTLEAVSDLIITNNPIVKNISLVKQIHPPVTEPNRYRLSYSKHSTQFVGENRVRMRSSYQITMRDLHDCQKCNGFMNRAAIRA
ncbi:hypothetical protein HZ326_14830 [Fusarium oxysporum f. sp. albedinis]|nr:hypothetical protein HZ326_14830 [Fusarium oxysporum f. sp. albedinis]